LSPTLLATSSSGIESAASADWHILRPPVHFSACFPIEGVTRRAGRGPLERSLVDQREGERGMSSERATRQVVVSSVSVNVGYRSEYECSIASKCWYHAVKQISGQRKGS
jgi:hypothetical protein